jgi:hypothetical protein
MRLFIFWPAVLLAPALLLTAQGNSGVLTVASVDKARAKRNETATVKVKLQLKEGYHVNSNKPSEDYLIPLKLTWGAEPLKTEEITYPKPAMEKYSFSEQPLSVYSGAFEIVTRFRVPATAPGGPALGTGKLRYQACNDRMCLPPKTIDVPLTIEIQ